MNESIKKMYEQEPKTWYAKIIVALIVAALLAWSLSTVQSTGSNGSGLSVAGKIISGIFHPDTGLLFDLSTSGVAYLLRTYVYPCDRTWTIRRTAYHVTLFDRYDQ